MLSATFKIADDNRRYLTRLVEHIKENYRHGFGHIDFAVESKEEGEVLVPLREHGRRKR